MIPWPLFFAYSFLVYSILRAFDEYSTRKIGNVLDLQVHEVNPVLTRMIRVVGIDRAFLALWIIIAAGVATIDTVNYVASPSATFGVPPIAVLLGSVHLLAAAHNWELKSRVQSFSKEEIREANQRYVRRIRMASGPGRLKIALERSLYAVYVTVLAGILAVALNYNPATGFAIPTPTNSAGFIAGQFLAGLLLFAPVMYIGNIVVMRRMVNQQARLEQLSGSSNSKQFPCPKPSLPQQSPLV